MKIEISEVFITRADSITMNAAISAIGIAALEPEPKTGGRWEQRLTALLRSAFGTPKSQQKASKLPNCVPSEGTGSCRLVPASTGLKKVTFTENFQPAQKQCAERID
jgi:hypothetical protein